MTVPVLPPPAVDLATLLGEMAALKAEVRAETRSARELREQLDSAVTRLTAELDRAQQREERLRAELAGTAAAARDEEARHLIELHDRLEALALAAVAPSRRRLFSRRPVVDPAARALGEGVGMMVSRVEVRLRELGVSRIRTVGTSLDPHRMEAVSAQHQPGQPPHTVLEEVASGWSAGGRVVRAAKVIVNTVDNSS